MILFLFLFYVVFSITLGVVVIIPFLPFYLISIEEVTAVPISTTVTQTEFSFFHFFIFHFFIFSFFLNSTNSFKHFSHI
jgi:hypothetical protein